MLTDRVAPFNLGEKKKKKKKKSDRELVARFPLGSQVCTALCRAVSVPPHTSCPALEKDGMAKGSVLSSLKYSG